MTRTRREVYVVLIMFFEGQEFARTHTKTHRHIFTFSMHYFNFTKSSKTKM